MPKVKLTDRFCAHAAARAGDLQTDYFDETTTGLTLRVSAGGTKAWSLVYSDPRTGKRARKTFGAYPATSLADARGKSLAAHRLLAEGLPPDAALEPPPPPVAMTVDAALDVWMKLHVEPNRKSADEVRKRLARHIRPALGARALDSITKGDVLAITDSLIRAGTPREANLCFEHVRAFCNWCVERDHLGRSPVAGLRMPAKETPRERVLSDEEIGVLWRGLDDAMTKTRAVPRVLRLCLLTGQRVGEVSGMARSELDLKARQWTIPSERSKNGSAHVVPLSDAALAIVEDALAEGDARRRYVFPSDRLDGGALTPLAVTRTLARALAPDSKRPRGRLGLEGFTPHDLRRTCLTGLAKLGHPPVVIGAVANHLSATKAGVTQAVYVKYTYAKEKRQALEAWGEYVSVLASGSTLSVVPLRKAKKGA